MSRIRGSGHDKDSRLMRGGASALLGEGGIPPHGVQGSGNSPVTSVGILPYAKSTILEIVFFKAQIRRILRGF
jgi:hypothetical protein